jgi:homocysteine S-methyltransferase
MSLDSLLLDYPREAAEGIMRGAIDLAYSCAEKGSTRAGVVLALGPYGAVLSPSQEYAGIYPSPYGPAPSPDASIAPSNAYPREDHSDEGEAEQALFAWHLARLRIYAADMDTWRKVEWVGFETIPLTREIRAIRRAMCHLYGEMASAWGTDKLGQLSDEGEGSESRGQREWWRKKFWITSAWPHGRHPQHLSDPAPRDSQASLVCVALLDEGARPDAYLRPDGIGINCTHPAHVAAIIEDFNSQMRSRLRALQSRILEVQPVFVLYPDGGAVYDTTTRTWTDRTTHPGEWARALRAHTETLRAASMTRQNSEDQAETIQLWGGVIAGGCCKAGYEEIRCLRETASTAGRELVDEAVPPSTRLVRES